MIEIVLMAKKCDEEPEQQQKKTEEGFVLRIKRRERYKKTEQYERSSITDDERQMNIE